MFRKIVLILFALLILLTLLGADHLAAQPPTPAAPIPTQLEVVTGAQNQAGNIIADLAKSRASRNPKLDSALADLAAAAQVSADGVADVARSQSLRLSGNRVHVQIVTHASSLENAIQAVTKAGGEVTGVGYDDTLIQGWLPVDALESVAAQDDVHYIRRPAELVLLEDLYVGNSTTEGLAAMNGPDWHAAGYMGAGVKIGVIDGGFTGYTSLLGTDLPSSVTVKNFVDGEDDSQVDGTTAHGTACAEIIHDVAPNATIYLAKTATNLDLAEAVTWLKDTHQVDIISTSLGWYTLTPGDGTGEFADLVQDARNAGILWVTAAGNDREAHWGGLYADADMDNFHEFNGKEVNCFGPGDGTCTNLNPGFQFTVYVRWNDWTNVDQDYDLHLVRWNGASWDIIASSTNTQNGGAGQRPTEAAIGTTSGSPTWYGFVIVRINSTQTVNFEVFVPKWVRPDEILYARSLANLADAPDAMTVAALDVTSPYPQEPYSSEGPTNGPGGAETGGSTKPDISAFANVATESYPGSTFDGTSAATPHVAGAAALVLGTYPGYTPDDIQSFLEGRAVDMGSAGKDTLFGYGRLHLGEAPQAGGWWEQVNTDGFGDDVNGAIESLEVFNDQLYAGATNYVEGTQIWRTPDGTTWTAASSPGFGSAYTDTNPLVFDMVEFDSQLYAATGSWSDDGVPGQLWRSPNGTSWTLVEGNGFGNSNNVGITSLVTRGGDICASTLNATDGLEVWCSSTGDNGDWSSLVTGGNGDADNTLITAMIDLDYLYVAVENQTDGTEIWRTDDGSVWTPVSTGGFGDTDNTQTGGFAVIDDRLCLGTRNDTTGGQIYCTANGTTWTPEMDDGFGNTDNIKIESLITYGGLLYAGTSNNTTGIEIWRSSDVSTWTQTNADGFGDANNTTTLWSNASAEFQGGLYVGTMNFATGGEVWRLDLSWVYLPLVLRND